MAIFMSGLILRTLNLKVWHNVVNIQVHPQFKIVIFNMI